MIVIGHKNIDANVEDILKTLKDFLQLRDGSSILRIIRPTGDNVMINCPFHKDGKERRPSCGISTVDKKDTPAGTLHCFSCNKTMFIDKFISYLLNYDDNGEEGRKWLLEHFDVSYTRKLNVNISREKVQVEPKTFIKEDQLKCYRYYHPYMFKRGLTKEIIERYDIGYDKYTDMITFPVRDIDGNCVFLAKRSVKGKMFLLPLAKNKPLYGVYELNYSDKDLYIVESFFNCLTLAKWGYNAIALMGTGSEYQYGLINKLPFRVIHLCLDGDAAGDIGIKKLLKNIDARFIVYVHLLPRGKDINDLTYEEFLKLNINRR